MCLQHVLGCSKHFIGPTLSSMMYSLENTDKKQKNVHFFCPLCPLFFVHFANLAVPWTKWTKKVDKVDKIFSPKIRNLICWK